MKDRLPPQAVDIEELLLGELITFPDAIDEVVALLSPGDFYRESNAKIFTAIKDLWSEGKKVDVVLVTGRLKKTNELETAGGAYVITKLTSEAITPVNVKDHALVVKEASVKRQFISYAAEVGNKAFAPESDIDDLLSLGNSGIDKITDGIFKAGSTLTFKSIIDNTIKEYFDRKAKFQEGKYNGIRTPLHDLSKITGGWQAGDLIIIAGRPSMGKTAFAVQCGVTSARTGNYTDIYTLEMTSSQFTQRIIACTEDINIERFRNGALNEHEEQRMEAVVNKLLMMDVNLDDKSGITAEYIKAKSSANRRKGKCDLIIIDYLQLMSYDAKLNSNEGYGSITRKMKNLAKDLNIPVILLSQLNRQLESRGNKRPTLADLRSSGEIEQDADLVIFPYREYYYSGSDADKGHIEIIVAKHRNGRTGSIEAYVNESITQFWDEKQAENTGGNLPF